jgi:hypothetical protein
MAVFLMVFLKSLSVFNDKNGRMAVLLAGYTPGNW